MAEWLDLEHRIWRTLQTVTDGKPARILVGFSGGADSLALLWALCRVAGGRGSGLAISACHVHHGNAATPAQQNYRDSALVFCQNFCEKHGIPFVAKVPAYETLSSEEEFRQFRHQALAEAKTQMGADWIALAHHADDLLETRLMRLIRGTGAQGLRAMGLVQRDLLRPLLTLPKVALTQYLQEFALAPVEDPSNAEAHAFRNWVRNEWLPLLERRQPGASESLARSLELLASEAGTEEENADPLAPSLSSVFLDGPALSRVGFMALSRFQQKQALAQFVFRHNKRDFTHAHIEELLKRLANSRNELTFRIGGIDWCVNAQQIWMRSE